jgi:hypothetical protein
MKSPVTPVLLAWLLFGLLGCSGGAPTLDLGDQSSGYFVWAVVHHTYEAADLDKAVAYADEGLARYGDTARRMQASLSEFPPTDPPESAYEYDTLNAVGFIAFVRADALQRKGDLAGAKASYSMVVEEFGYAQIQDLGEWKGEARSVPRDAQGFLRLADVAKLRLAEIEAGGD